jgi:hypothetical protein
MIHGSGDFRVKVGWGVGLDVQVGVEGDDGRSLFWLLLGSHAELLGAEVRRVVAEANETDSDGKVVPLGDFAIGQNVLNVLDVVSHGGYAGLWADLDRRGCNELIRVLRRARDSAFGRDE